MIAPTIQQIKNLMDAVPSINLVYAVHDSNGNAFAGYPDNRAGRRKAEQDLGINPFRCKHGCSGISCVHGHPASRWVGVEPNEEDVVIRAKRHVFRARRRIPQISGGVAVNWYVRKGGSDTNGGSSSSTTPDRQGTDGTTSTTTFSSATGAFTSGDVGKGINIGGTLYRITAFTNSTTVTIDRSAGSAAGQTWKLGGALATITKMLQTTATIMQNGDTLWIGAGTYRETFTLNLTGITAETFITGDNDGSHTGDAGDVILTSYLTNDKTAATTNSQIIFNGKSFLTWQKMFFQNGASGAIANAQVTTSQNIKFQDCVLVGYGNGTNLLANITTVFGTGLSWTFDRCSLFQPAANNVIQITAPLGTGADYDLNFLVQNCRLYALGNSSFFNLPSSGTGSNKPGGVKAKNCTYIGRGAFFATAGTNYSTTIPCNCVNSIVASGGATCLSAFTAGQITEDYNILYSTSTRANVTAGTHSIADGSYALMLELGQAEIFGRSTRPLYAPTVGSPQLGFGDDGTAPSVDALNRSRPAGGQSASKATGALERANTWGRETTTTHSGANALSITGPGYQDFDIPVDAVSTTITVYLRCDATYAGTKPQLKVLNGGECGVADATDTMTAAANTWDQRSLTFTPTSKGIVTIRIQSNDTNGGGKAFADTRNF